MKFIVLIYTDPELLNAVPSAEFDETMRGCLAYADDQRQKGRLLDSQMLQGASTAKSIRVRKGRQEVVDGPFAETKELLAGFNLIDAADMDEAMEMASHFPWATVGCIEVRPILDIDTVRRRVGA
jgi:hypothetical protein